jgi:hypothetical protein
MMKLQFQTGLSRTLIQKFTNMKYLLIPLLFVSNLYISAQCLEGNCKTGNGVYKYQNGAKYSGSFKNSQPNGEGTLLYSNGDKYEGHWENSMRHGFGTMYFQSGDWYEGEFANNKFDGSGTYHFNDGRKYHGKWQSDKPDGMGTLYKPGQGPIGGIWNQGKLLSTQKISELSDCNLEYCGNGVGRYTYADGSVFEGEFLNGIPYGEGVCYYLNGNIYKGTWRHHEPNGFGKMTMKNGTEYQGKWQYGILQKEEKEIHSEELEMSRIFALLVGVSRYVNFPGLKYTDDDAYRLYAFFKSPEGGAVPDHQIKIFIDESATKSNIIDAMNQITELADENDAVFCFFSGHGIDGSFLPIDSDGYRNKLTYTEIKELLEQCRAKQKVYIADACYSGSFLSPKNSLTQSIDNFYNHLNETSGGTAFLLSSKKEEYSLESKGLRQGIFSHYLLKGLNGASDLDGNKIVTVGELFNYVHTEVRNYSKNNQTPVIAGNFDQDMPIGMIR